MPKSFESRFSHLVHHGCYSHLTPNIFVPKPIFPSMPTHPFQHSHFRYFIFWTCEFLTGQHSALYNIAGLTTTLYYLPLSLGDTSLSHKTPDASLHFIHPAPMRYLAEAPNAFKDEVTELLGYMLSIEGEDELSPFYSICFLLPMLCQITLKTGGCKVLASTGAFKEVVDCLIALIDQNNYTSEDNGSIFLACDTILNLLLKREQIKFPSADPSFIRLLVALSHWAEGTDDASIIMMVSSICLLILDLTSEGALLNHPDFTSGNIVSLSKHIGRSFAMCGQLNSGLDVG